MWIYRLIGSFTCNVLLRCFRSLACSERLVPRTDSSLTLAFTNIRELWLGHTVGVSHRHIYVRSVAILMLRLSRGHITIESEKTVTEVILSSHHWHQGTGPAIHASQWAMPYSRILHYYSDQGDATIPVFSQDIIMIRVTVELSTGLPQGTSPRPQNIPLISQINAALGYGCVGLPQFLFRGRFSRTPNWTISPVQENL